VFDLVTIFCHPNKRKKEKNRRKKKGEGTI
jgi:hypothetical protein